MGGATLGRAGKEVENSSLGRKSLEFLRTSRRMDGP
jgi:hypothetical protein